MSITVEELTTNETVPSKSRTFSTEVVQRVYDLLRGADGNAPVRNIGIGTFDKEGGARSALASLNKLLKEQHSAGPYAATVRGTDDGKFKAILLNKPARKVEPTENGTATAKPTEPATTKKS